MKTTCRKAIQTYFGVLTVILLITRAFRTRMLASIDSISIQQIREICPQSTPRSSSHCVAPYVFVRVHVGISTCLTPYPRDSTHPGTRIAEPPTQTFLGLVTRSSPTNVCWKEQYLPFKERLRGRLGPEGLTLSQG